MSIWQRPHKRCLLLRKADAPARLELVVRARGGKRKQISVAAVLELCYSDIMRCADLGRVYGLSRRSERRLLCCVAQAFVQRPEARLAGALAELRQFCVLELAHVKEDPRMVRTSRGWFVNSIAHDETQERLVLPIVTVPGDVRNTARSTWHVLVAHQSIAFGIPNSRNDDRVSRGSFDVLRPVMPLLSTSAECIYHGLFETATCKRLAEMEASCCGQFGAGVVHHSQDGATSNDRMLAARAVSLPPHMLGSKMSCGNHRNHLCEVATQHFFGAGVLINLFTTAMYFHMGLIGSG